MRKACLLSMGVNANGRKDDLSFWQLPRHFRYRKNRLQIYKKAAAD
jgi:hypothetical protein